MPAEIRDSKASSEPSPTKNALIKFHRSYKCTVGSLMGRRYRGAILRHDGSDGIPQLIFAKSSECTELDRLGSIVGLLPGTTRDSLFSSIETIVLFSGSILGAAVVLWALWKIYGFIGFPIGRMFLRVGKRDHLDTQQRKDFQSTFSGAVIGGFLCYGLIAWNFVNPVGKPPYSLPGQELYDMTLWATKTILQACGESVVVLAILSGVVKMIGLDKKKEVAVGLGKEEGRLA